MIRFSVLSILISLVVLAPARLGCAGDVIVALHETPTTISDQTVRVGDVARVLGGNASDRRAIEQLDLESLGEQAHCSITRKQVQMRLMLAGYQRGSFDVTGPVDIFALRSSPTQRRSELERSLQSEIGRQFGVDPNRVSVRLTSEIQMESLKQKNAFTGNRIKLLSRNEFPIGRTRLNVELIDASGVRLAQMLDAQISLSTKVVIAAEPIARGKVISPEMVRLVDREITARSDYANPEEIVGRTASRYIGSNSIVMANHLVAPRRGSNEIVKRNDLVDVVIKVGNGEIRLKGARAMESGQMGDTIEILNPNTNRRINASIVGPNLATLSPATRRL